MLGGNFSVAATRLFLPKERFSFSACLNRKPAGGSLLPAIKDVSKCFNEKAKAIRRSEKDVPISNMATEGCQTSRSERFLQPEDKTHIKLKSLRFSPTHFKETIHQLPSFIHRGAPRAGSDEGRVSKQHLTVCCLKKLLSLLNKYQTVR